VYLRSLFWILGLVLLLIAVAVIAGIGLAAVAGKTFGVVNFLISVLAAAAVLVWSTQRGILPDRETDPARQRETRQRETQQRQADLAVRKMHAELIRMALANRHLAAVRPRIARPDPVTESQHMYASLLLQHVWAEYSAERSTREQMVNNVRYLFASSVIRDFWRATVNGRYRICIENSEQVEFVAVVDEVWRRCEAVPAFSAEPPARATPDRDWAADDLQDPRWVAENPAPETDPLPPPPPPAGRPGESP